MKLKYIIAFGLLFLMMAGCSQRHIITAADHSRLPATLVETRDVDNYLFFGRTRTRYWECSDQGDTLVCKAACDTESSDLVCPTIWGAYW